MAKYRKKPVVIEAWEICKLWDDAVHNFSALPKPVIAAHDKGIIVFKSDCILVETLEGQHKGNLDDMLIQGVAGELYPIKNLIFQETYEAVDG